MYLKKKSFFLLPLLPTLCLGGEIHCRPWERKKRCKKGIRRNKFTKYRHCTFPNIYISDAYILFKKIFLVSKCSPNPLFFSSTRPTFFRREKRERETVAAAWELGSIKGRKRMNRRRRREEKFPTKKGKEGRRNKERGGIGRAAA